MQKTLSSLEELYDKNAEDFLRHFFTFLSFQSISSEPAFKPEMEKCVHWLKKYIEEIGFTCELWPTSGHPTLFCSWEKAGPDKPTLLIYNHYDVQPVDPIEGWDSPPFEPTIRDGNIFARGAQDNKGQCFYVLQALKLLMQRDGSFPLNIKLCIEGEEECGSHGLAGILQKHQKELKADYLAIVDLGILNPHQPAVTLGFRGMVSLHVEVEGSNTDLHSGSHGGIVYNPLHALVELLSKLREPSGEIAVPGFYDNVKTLSPEMLKKLSLHFDTQAYEKTFGTKASGGEEGLSPLERNWLRPALEINGIIGGYTGDGFKTVIPAKAKANLSCRLVPDQDPMQTGNLIADFLKKNAPEGVSVKVDVHPGGGKPIRSTESSKAVTAFTQSLEEVYQAHCDYILSGASIPVVAELALASQSEIVLLGLGLDTDQIHAPNEHFSLDRLKKGCLMIARGIELLS